MAAPIEQKRKRKRRLGAILPYLDITLSPGITPPQFLNYSGIFYGNPTPIERPTVVSVKSNSSDRIVGINANIYRYTIVPTNPRGGTGRFHWQLSY